MFPFFFALSLSLQTASPNDVCTLLMNHLEPSILRGRSITSLTSDAFEFCRLLDPEHSRTCTAFAATHLTSITQSLINGDSPLSACARPFSTGDVFCDFCVNITDYIVELVFEGFLQTQIEALLDDLCNFLPSPINTFCVTFINENVEAIIASIVDPVEADAVAICGEIGLCGAGNGRRARVRVGARTCNACHEVAAWVRGRIADGATDSEIEAELQRLADKRETIGMIGLSPVGRTIVESARSGGSPDEVCGKHVICRAVGQ
jgi:hypothetical protein